MEGVATDLIANIEGYQQLLTTLALGVCAGAFALVTQVIFHNNSNPSSKVELRAVWLLFAGIGLSFLSILAGIATKSTLVSSVPALHSIKWQDLSATEQLRNAGLSAIQWCSTGQIVLFALGILCFVLMLFLNVRLLK